MKKIPATQKMVFAALFAAATTVATMISKIPIIPGGYFNLGETMIFTAALTFGPLVGGIAGGLGAAIADLFGGYLLPWAPITFLLKGLEGYIAGKIGHNKELGGKILATLLGGLVIIIGYPVASALLYGWPAFLPELYVDIIQVVVGGLVAIPLSATLRKIFNEEMMQNESR